MAGAINNVFILPEAFSDFKSGMGFIGVMVSIATICGQIFSFSTYSVLVNWIPKLKDESKEKNLLGFSFSTLLVGIAVFLISFYLGKDVLANWFAADNQILFYDYLVPIIIICVAQIVFLYFSGFLNSRFKSVLVTALQDPFLKITYLIIAVLFLTGYIDYAQLVWSFIFTYVLVAGITFLSSLKLGFRYRLHSKIENAKEVINYSIFSLLDKSAATLILRMDLLMLAFILDLDYVAEYMVAFFIGMVVYIPFKSIQPIGNTLVSKAIGNNDNKELLDIYTKSSFYSLLLGGFIFCAIWINIDEILLVLNEKFRNGKWVILFIGVAKLIQTAGGVNAAIIVYSNKYRFNLILNLALVLLVFVTNLLLIPAFGINGAALATLISLVIHALIKLIFIQIEFKIQPFTANTFKLISVFGVLLFGFWFFPELGLHPIIQGIIKGSLFTAVFLGALKIFRIVPELNSLRDLKNLF